MASTPQEMKMKIVQEGVKKILEEAQVPQHVHMKVLKALSAEFKKGSAERAKHEEQIGIHQKQIEEHTKAQREHVRQIDEWDGKVNDWMTKDWTGPEGPVGVGIPGPQGEKGDMPTVDINEIARVAALLVPQPKDGEKGESGKDAEVEKVYTYIIERITKEKPLDISHVRNAQGFIKDGIKYRFEELMKGGGSTSSSGISIITITGTIDDSNTSFTATSQPTLLNINGAFYQKTGGAITWTYVAGTITLSSAVGTGGSIYGI